MIGFLVPAITTDDVLEWWEESEPLPIPRAEAAAAIDQYFREIQGFQGWHDCGGELWPW
jgi:hypothetical protein